MTNKTKDEWQEQLTPAQYDVCRCGGTEPPFSSEFNEFYDEGLFRCICCDAPLFATKDKYNSGSGWPSFTQPVDNDAVRLAEDNSLGMQRVEVRCASCDAHLGHVFPDGPESTNMRFCINGTALSFEPEE